MNNIEKTTKDSLVSVNDDGELRTSSIILAGGMQQQHRSVLQLARRHWASLEQFGRVAFEMQTFDTCGGPQIREVLFFNERQATVLTCFMKNSPRVVDFKVRLVHEFFRMKDALDAREKNLWQQMQAHIAKEVESQVRASFGSHLMLKRKKEKPALKTERDILEAAIQPSLLN